MPIPIYRRPGTDTSLGDHERRLRALERVANDLKVTDGITTVDPADELDFGAGLVVTDLGGGVAEVEATPLVLKPPRFVAVQQLITVDNSGSPVQFTNDANQIIWSNDVPEEAGYDTENGGVIAKDGSWTGDYYSGWVPISGDNTIPFALNPPGGHFVMTVAAEVATTAGMSPYSLIVVIRGPQGNGSAGVGLGAPGDTFVARYAITALSDDADVPFHIAETFVIFRAGSLDPFNFVQVTLAQDSGSDVAGAVEIHIVRVSPTT